jgi:hypothetical protein
MPTACSGASAFWQHCFSHSSWQAATAACGPRPCTGPRRPLPVWRVCVHVLVDDLLSSANGPAGVCLLLAQDSQGGQRARQMADVQLNGVQLHVHHMQSLGRELLPSPGLACQAFHQCRRPAVLDVKHAAVWAAVCAVCWWASSAGESQALSPVQGGQVVVDRWKAAVTASAGERQQPHQRYLPLTMLVLPRCCHVLDRRSSSIFVDPIQNRLDPNRNALCYLSPVLYYSLRLADLAVPGPTAPSALRQRCGRPAKQ